jgi:hypothetical protein
MALLAFAVAGTASLLYRAYLGERAPLHVPAIVGLGTVGLWMNTASAIVQFVESTATPEPLVLQEMGTNVAALLAAGLAVVAGARVGDRLAPNLRALTGARQLDSGVNRLVKSVGRFISVKLPGVADVEDLDGYEPVSQETKETFAGLELLFPRGLTVDQLHRRVVDRLREDYGVGAVDLELTPEGSVDHLAVGSRASGIGPTLPPRKAVVAVDANPPPEASPGDRVRLWRETPDGAESLLTAELRAADGDLTTLTVDASRAGAVGESESYDLVTLAARKQPEKEFAALLRTANKTMDTTTVEAGSVIEGTPVGALRPTVAAIRAEDGPVDTLSGRTRVCAAGDTVYAVGRPDELRKLDDAATVSPDGESVSTGYGDRVEEAPVDTGVGPIRAMVARFPWP